MSLEQQTRQRVAVKYVSLALEYALSEDGSTVHYTSLQDLLDTVPDHNEMMLEAFEAVDERAGWNLRVRIEYGEVEDWQSDVNDLFAAVRELIEP